MTCTSYNFSYHVTYMNLCTDNTALTERILIAKTIAIHYILLSRVTFVITGMLASYVIYNCMAYRFADWINYYYIDAQCYMEQLLNHPNYDQHNTSSIDNQCFNNNNNSSMSWLCRCVSVLLQ